MPRKKPSKKSRVSKLSKAQIENLNCLSQFLRWMGQNGLGIVGFYYPSPRIRGGKIYKRENCIRITVQKKLSVTELHPNSTQEWEYLWGHWQAGDRFQDMTFADTTPILIPKTLIGLPVDIVEGHNDAAKTA